MVEPRSAILQGTLDLMVLKTLELMGPLHGYGIARRIEQVGGQAVIVNQGTIYLCLVRLLQKRWISAKWGTSENNRKAKFYAITRAGRAQLKAETENWERISGVIGRVLQPDSGLPADQPPLKLRGSTGALAKAGLPTVVSAKAGS
jgi:PadR family transcriptional regulator, regulatory protein PadR